MSDPNVDLAIDLLAHPSWEDEESQTAGAAATRLVPGELPPNLPFDLPVPDGSRIVGSLMHGARMTALLDSALDPPAVTQWYRERFDTQGWRASSMEDVFNRLSGEERPQRPDASVTLCQSTTGPLLVVDARPNGDGTTAVEFRIDLQPAPERCAEPPADLFSMDVDDLSAMVGDDRLDMIATPPGSEVHGGGGGGSSDGHAHRHVELLTDLAPYALAAHYRQEWLDRGWTLVAEEVNGPVAWSVWSGSNERGKQERASWLAVRLPETPKRYSLEMTIDRESGGPEEEHE